MSSLSSKTAPFQQVGWGSVVLVNMVLVNMVALVGAGSAQTIDYGQSLPRSGSFASPPTLNSLDSAVPLTVQSVGTPADLSTLTATPGLGQYVVYVNGDSDLLLQQVRRVEPGAFRRSYDNRQVIQAGRFFTLNNAQERVTELENRGILAEIVTLGTAPIAGEVTGGNVVGGNVGGNVLPTTPIALDTAPLSVNTSLEFTAPTVIPELGTASPNLSLGQSQAYYVAIPTKPGNLANLSDQLATMGISPTSIFAKASRRGAFIAVGPYSDRLSAEVMMANIKNAGFGNARVYYGY